MTTLALIGAQQDPTTTSERVLPNLGVTVRDVRVLDRTTGSFVRTTTVDGEPVDADALYRAEAAARDNATGKLWGVLPAMMQKHKTVQVAFWLEHSAAQPDLREVLDQAVARGASTEDARREALATAARFVGESQQPFVRALQQAGIEVDYQDSYVPLVFATMKAADIKRFAARADVDQAFYSSPKWEHEGPAPTLPNRWASPTARTDFVHQKGIDGNGVKVLVNDTRPMVTNNPFLPPVIVGNPGSPASHATAVAGIISSSHPVETGAAPGLTEIYDYGGSGDTVAPMAWSWGMQQGISFGNCSWWNFQRGGIEFLDRYFDYIIRNFGVMMFKSCGNQGNGNPVTTPGNGYNVTSSGNAQDNNNHDWDDDTMRSSSSTGNPREGHEKPEVTAHGSGITSTTTSSPWINGVGSGTSYASPVTCGTAALLAQTDTALTAKPEVVKAMLMAGAWNNIHGSSPLSDYDGAGAIDAAASQRAVADGQYLSTDLTPSSFSGGFYTWTINLDAGDETRVVALWFSEADSSYTTDNLNMDLDMVILAPGGAVVASSASADNPFEIVEFVPPTSGTYTVRMQNQRFQGTSEPFAIAWTSWQDAATNRVVLNGSGAAGTTLQFEWNDPYSPGELYVGLMSTTSYPALTPLGTDRILPMGFDGLSMATFNGLPDFIGTLDANGQATAQLPIPFIPPIQIYVGMFTFKANPARAAETSDVVSTTIGS